MSHLIDLSYEILAKCLEKFEPQRASFSTYYYRALNSGFKSERLKVDRRRRRMKRLGITEVSGDEGIRACQDSEPKWNILPDSNIEDPIVTLIKNEEVSELAIRLRSAINKLPERQKSVILSYYFDDKDTLIIAKELGISPSTVTSTLLAARKALLHLLANP